jgi:hypothetical protein
MEVVAELALDWKLIDPKVNREGEFLEIANDFGDPLEILREAISNSIDAGANWVKIEIKVEEIEGGDTLVIMIEDNGHGMDAEALEWRFWGLGYSERKKDPTTIGEKGHGTKIYLRSEEVIVRTQTETDAFESKCERPLRALTQGKTHRPEIRQIPKYQDKPGTTVTILGYNKNERSKFTQDVVTDYILWFTKVGSIEKMLNHMALETFQVELKCLDATDFAKIPFGHPFPTEDPDINKLFAKHGSSAANYYVRRYIKSDCRLEKFPDVCYDIVISVEGDLVKRSYNPQIRERRSKDSGQYKVGDRYGIWLCKDFMPVERVNNWISGFGSGSNAYTLLHGFINCQKLKLTANRGSIANTDPNVLMELRAALAKMLDEIDGDLAQNGIYTLFDWQAEERTLEQERKDFESRVKSISKRRKAELDGRILVEPRNEAELFGLFTTVYALKPDLFSFAPNDYSTSRGIDIIAKNKKQDVDAPFCYVELKYQLRTKLNHGFKYLRWIVCWNFETAFDQGDEFGAIQEKEPRKLEFTKANGETLYYLNSPVAQTKVQIIRLEEFLKEKLGLEFKVENP